jgi:hypothetical protein
VRALLLLALVGCTSLAGDTPVIASIAWHHDPTCTPGIPSNVVFTITVDDSNTLPGDLIITGGVTGCTGTIASVQSTLGCPEGPDVTGSVTVSDPQGNATRKSFIIQACVDGRV